LNGGGMVSNFNEEGLLSVIMDLSDVLGIVIE
jgi:hypothetical protein